MRLILTINDQLLVKIYVELVIFDNFCLHEYNTFVNIATIFMCKSYSGFALQCTISDDFPSYYIPL